MIDVVQIQDDLVGVLLSYEGLANVNVKSYRRMRLAQELNFRTLIETRRQGRCGAGILVEQPTATSPRPNVSGPVLAWMFPVTVIEQADINMHPTAGTLLSSEEIVQRILDAVHLHSDARWGTLNADDNAASPAKDLEDVFAGCVCYRVNLSLKAGLTVQTARCAPVTLAVANGQCTITGGIAGGEIWVTTDGSFPGWQQPNSAQYTGVFPVVSGDKVRAACYKTGLNVSEISYLEV